MNGEHPTGPASAPAAAPVRLITAPFLVVSISTFAFFCAVGIGLPVVPRFVTEELGGGDLAVGVSVAALSVAAIACRPLLAIIGDRSGRRLLLTGGSLLAAVAFAVSGYAPGLAALVVLRMVIGVGEAAQFVGAATLVNDLSPPERRAEAASYFSVSVFGGLGIGPLIGDVLADQDRFVAAFLICGVLASVAAVLGLLAPGGPPRAGAGEDGPRRRPRAFHRDAVPTGIVLAMAMCGYTAWVAFLPLQAPQRDVSAGLLFGIYSAFVLVLRIAGAKVPERLGLGRCAGVAVVAVGAGLVAMAVVPGGAGLVGGTMVMSLGIALLYPSLMAITVNRAADDERAGVVSTFTMFFEVGGAVGGPLLGFVASQSSYDGAFFVGGVIAIAGLPVLHRLVIAPPKGRIVATAP